MFMSVNFLLIFDKMILGGGPACSSCGKYVLRSPTQKALYFLVAALEELLAIAPYGHCMALTFLLVHFPPNHS